MASSSGERVVGSLKRPFPVKGDNEIAAEDASRSLERGGGGEDVSEESLSKLQKEVAELAEKVAEYREKGPVAFAHLLEKSLEQMRTSVSLTDTQVNKPTNGAAEITDDLASSDKELLAQRTELLERLASAKESLPILLRDVKACRERLEKAMTARRQSQAKDLPPHPALDRDVTELFSLPIK